MYSRGCHTSADLKSKILAETANRADPGQLQLWSEPSEIVNLRSSNTPETVLNSQYILVAEV